MVWNIDKRKKLTLAYVLMFYVLIVPKANSKKWKGHRPKVNTYNDDEPSMHGYRKGKVDKEKISRYRKNQDSNNIIVQELILKRVDFP